MNAPDFNTIINQMMRWEEVKRHGQKQAANNVLNEARFILGEVQRNPGILPEQIGEAQTRLNELLNMPVIDQYGREIPNSKYLKDPQFTEQIKYINDVLLGQEKKKAQVLIDYNDKFNKTVDAMDNVAIEFTNPEGDKYLNIQDATDNNVQEIFKELNQFYSSNEAVLKKKIGDQTNTLNKVQNQWNNYNSIMDYMDMLDMDKEAIGLQISEELKNLPGFDMDRLEELKGPTQSSYHFAKNAWDFFKSVETPFAKDHLKSVRKFMEKIPTNPYGALNDMMVKNNKKALEELDLLLEETRNTGVVPPQLEKIENLAFHFMTQWEEQSKGWDKGSFYNKTKLGMPRMDKFTPKDTLQANMLMSKEFETSGLKPNEKGRWYQDENYNWKKQGFGVIDREQRDFQIEFSKKPFEKMKQDRSNQISQKITGSIDVAGNWTEGFQNTMKKVLQKNTGQINLADPETNPIDAINQIEDILYDYFHHIMGKSEEEGISGDKIWYREKGGTSLKPKARTSAMPFPDATEREVHNHWNNIIGNMMTAQGDRKQVSRDMKTIDEFQFDYKDNFEELKDQVEGEGWGPLDQFLSANDEKNTISMLQDLMSYHSLLYHDLYQREHEDYNQEFKVAKAESIYSRWGHLKNKGFEDRDIVLTMLKENWNAEDLQATSESHGKDIMPILLDLKKEGALIGTSTYNLDPFFARDLEGN